MYKLVFMAGGLYLAYFCAIIYSAGLRIGDKEGIFNLLTNPIFEIGIIWICFYLTATRKRILRVMFYCISIFLTLLFLVQIMYLALNGEYIQLLALENLNQLYLLTSFKNLLLLSPIVVFIVGVGILLFRLHLKSKCSIITLSLAVILCVIVSLLQNGYFIKNKSKYKNYIRNTPIVSFLDNCLALSGIKHRSKGLEDVVLPINYINKNEIYGNRLPYDLKKGIIVEQRPNIILIFTEGTSARLLGCYGGKFSGLTSRIDDFADNATVIRNYFNHTAATFRGTHGQLASCYPEKGGYGKGQWADADNKDDYKKHSYQTLPNVLNAYNYETIFISPHLKSDPYTSLLEMLKFRRVLTAEDCERITGTVKMHNGGLRDIDVYNTVINVLSEREDSKPVFLSFYTVGTHAFMDTYDGGKKYTIDNASLNTLYTLDYSFGKFWQWFKKSKYAENTILIFTADHAHYYDKPYLEVMQGDKDYKKYFVDKIPLIIYDPFHKLPKTIDVNGKTSLDLTPTILHLLEINDVKNSFLGKSLFDMRNSDLVNIAALGHEFYCIYNNEVYNYKDLDETSILKKFAKHKVSFIKGYYRLEANNEVFSE